MLGGIHSRSLYTRSCISGQNDPITGVAIPSKGTMPLYYNLQTSAAVNITGTTSVDHSSANILDLIKLSSIDYAYGDIEVGDFIYVNNLAIPIKEIFPSRYLIQLRYPLASGSPMSAAPILVAKKQLYRSLTIESTGIANTATVNGTPLKSGDVRSFNNQGDVECIFYTADGTNEQLRFDFGF